MVVFLKNFLFNDDASRRFVLAHVSEVLDASLYVVDDGREVDVGNVFLVAKLFDDWRYFWIVDMAYSGKEVVLNL